MLYRPTKLYIEYQIRDVILVNKIRYIILDKGVIYLNIALISGCFIGVISDKEYTCCYIDKDIILLKTILGF